MRDEQDLIQTIEKYADTVKRICVVYLKNSSDTEDIFQNVFLKYMRNSAHFQSEEHKKAFFIRITINECKDLLKSFFRKNTVSIDEVGEIVAPSYFDENAYVRQAVLKLPENYRVVIYLHYFEGYSAVEIGKMLTKNVNTVYTLMARGREMLKESLGGDMHA
ncbi:MAG: RNA polymerase sigma factor [Erysipelotrichaceae bacterium]